MSQKSFTKTSRKWENQLKLIKFGCYVYTEFVLKQKKKRDKQPDVQFPRKKRPLEEERANAINSVCLGTPHIHWRQFVVLCAGLYEHSLLILGDFVSLHWQCESIDSTKDVVSRQTYRVGRCHCHDILSSASIAEHSKPESSIQSLQLRHSFQLIISDCFMCLSMCNKHLSVSTQFHYVFIFLFFASSFSIVFGDTKTVHTSFDCHRADPKIDCASQISDHKFRHRATLGDCRPLEEYYFIFLYADCV